MRLQGKVAVVTGAGGGFGEGIARRFGAEGARVVVADINVAAARKVALEIGNGAVAIAGDVSQGKDVAMMVSAAVDRFGGLDIVVNNAGTTHRNQPLLDVPEAEFDRVFAVNVKSIYWMAQAAVPVWRKQGRGGSLINISSTAGIRPRPGLVWYNGTKGAVNTMTQCMAIELAPDNIRVNAICPVLGATGLTELFMGQPDSPEIRQKFLSTIPLGRMSKASDIAAAAVYLASDEAEFITGVVLPVDGGRTI